MQTGFSESRDVKMMEPTSPGVESLQATGKDDPCFFCVAADGKRSSLWILYASLLSLRRHHDQRYRLSVRTLIAD